MYKLPKIFLFVIMLFFVDFCNAQESHKENITISVRTTIPISSKNGCEHYTENCVEVSDDVFVGDELFVKEGTPVDVRVETFKARTKNRVGSVTIYFIGLKASNEKRIFLEGCYTKGGKLHSWKWLHGKDAYIPAGTLINVTGSY